MKNKNIDVFMLLCQRLSILTAGDLFEFLRRCEMENRTGSINKKMLTVIFERGLC